MANAAPISRTAHRALSISTRSVFRPTATRPNSQAQRFAVARPQTKCLYSTTPRASSTFAAGNAASRPRLDTVRRHPVINSRRTIFIQTENTPNPDALKFLPNHRILPEGLSSPFLEYLNPRSTLAPPHPSPLATSLFNVDGVTSIFYGADFITVTKSTDANWAHIKPEVFSLITEAVSSGAPIVNTVEQAGKGAGSEAGQEGANGAQDSLGYDESDSEVVGMIKELLETRIRPAIQEDGGDIEFRGFENGNVRLKLRGACRTCDSSTVTLKNGIESMLMHYIEEVKGVEQVLDQEEEIAMQEFAKFEEKLKQQQQQSQPQASA
ncbi:MAG: hypothetical protein M4579_000068 [Chaenotheca gracillima]|nr:MAG: hypothetical protein M4579_000068 [Chaenotheca gracillima]